jgi:hypothetical protein
MEKKTEEKQRCVRAVGSLGIGTKIRVGPRQNLLKSRKGMLLAVEIEFVGLVMISIHNSGVGTV